MRSVILLLLLAGCTTVPQIQKVEVPVPVIKPCIQASDIPQPPQPALQPGVNVERLAAGAAADLLEQRAYNRQLRAMLEECAQSPSGV